MAIVDNMRMGSSWHDLKEVKEQRGVPEFSSWKSLMLDTSPLYAVLCITIKNLFQICVAELRPLNPVFSILFLFYWC